MNSPLTTNAVSGSIELDPSGATYAPGAGEIFPGPQT